MAIRGSCHCGKMAFTVDDDPTEAIQCNCSICRRRGSILAAVDATRFTLLTPRDEITVYTFNKHKIRHQFCRTCGCAPFADSPDSKGGGFVIINLRCVDDFDLSRVKISEFDGASAP